MLYMWFTYICRVPHEPLGCWGGAELHFHSPEPDTSLHCKSMYYCACSHLQLILPNHEGMPIAQAELTWWLVSG